MIKGRSAKRELRMRLKWDFFIFFLDLDVLVFFLLVEATLFFIFHLFQYEQI